MGPRYPVRYILCSVTTARGLLGFAKHSLPIAVAIRERWNQPWRGPSTLPRTPAPTSQTSLPHTPPASPANISFADGNKRTAWIIARLFLADNGYKLQFDKTDAIRTVEALAAGALSEDDLASWFRVRLLRRDYRTKGQPVASVKGKGKDGHVTV